MKKFLFLLLFLALYSIVYSNEPNLIELNQKIENLNYELDITQQNQINYRIEKDLLKEAYSSSIQSINIVITIILAVFTVIGLLGIKSINNIKADYKKELDSLVKLKEDIETQINKTNESQNQIEQKYSSIAKINEEQNLKIKNLEVQEKVNSLLNRHDFLRALEYIKVAYEYDQENLILLSQKATCHWKLKQYNEAIVTYNKIIEIDPNDIGAKKNLLELLLISEQINEYKSKLEKFKNIFTDKDDDQTLLKYLNILSEYVNGIDIEPSINKYISEIKEKTISKFNWNFKDVIAYLSNKEKDHQYRIMNSFISLLQGTITIEQHIINTK